MQLDFIMKHKDFARDFGMPFFYSVIFQFYHRFRNTISNVPLYVQYSKYNHLQSKAPVRQEGTPSRTLLVTIHNPLYQITIEVLCAVFNKYDDTKCIEKAVIFQRRSGLQALIQFSSVESATKALHALDKKNIYRDCCTLQIQYSKQSELNIRENSEFSHDFISPNIPEHSSKGGILPLSNSVMLSSGYGGMGPMNTYPGFQHHLGGMMPHVGGMPMSGMMGGPMGGPVGMGAGRDMSGNYHCVIIVSDFPPDKIGCDQLFNLFSNYGNIVRIKILHSKHNTALVQFTDPVMAHNAVQYLKNVTIQGSQLSVNFSVHNSISSPPEIRTAIRSGNTQLTASEGHASTDGRTVEYENSPLNRFTRVPNNAIRHATSPTEYVHVSNLAQTTTDKTLSAFIERVARPLQVKIFDKDGRTMAIAQMPNVESVVHAVCFLNNEVCDGKKLRFAFTKSRI